VEERQILVASGANSEPTPGPVFDEASSGTAKGDAEYRRWRPGRRIAKNDPPVRVARKQKGPIRRMMNAEPRNGARPTAYRSLAREHSGLLGTYVCTHQGTRNTSTSRHQQGVGPLFAPAATRRMGSVDVDDGLPHSVRSRFEHLDGFLDLIEREAMGNDPLDIDLPGCEELH